MTARWQNMRAAAPACPICRSSKDGQIWTLGWTEPSFILVDISLPSSISGIENNMPKFKRSSNMGSRLDRAKLHFDLCWWLSLSSSISGIEKVQKKKFKIWVLVCWLYFDQAWVYSNVCWSRCEWMIGMHPLIFKWHMTSFQFPQNTL